MKAERIRNVKNLKVWDDETEEETDEPAPLEEKFIYLLDILEFKETQINELDARLKRFEETWMNHRHGVVNGLYSGKAER